MSTVLVPAASAAPVPAASPAQRPWLGIVAVLLGTVAATLTSRVSSVGLADIRGAIGAGFDEGAWITSAYGIAQMLIGPVAVWFGRVAGIRTVLLWGALLFGLTELAIPLVPDLHTIVALQFLAGLASGVFVPLTIGFILQSLPPKLWAYGIGAYSLNLVFSVNIASTLEGWYVEHWRWHWIFWQNAVLAVPLLAAVRWGLPKSNFDREMHRQGDYWGMALAASGLALLYAALDQGDRLDWLGSDFIVNTAALGAVLVGLFLIHETVADKPGIDFRFLLRPNITRLLVLIVVVRFLITASSFVAPQFLTVVRTLRPTEIGEIFLWIALPQFLLAPIVAWLLNRFDARPLIAFGMALIAAACWMASAITSDWAEAQFIPSQLVQAVGQSFALTAIVFFFTQHLKPAEAVAFGALLQTARLFGGELGTAGLALSSRKFEHAYSNAMGDHVGAYDPLMQERVQGYASAVTASSQGTGTADALANGLLGSAMRAQSYTLAYAEVFRIAAIVAVVALAIALTLRYTPRAGAPPAATPR